MHHVRGADAGNPTWLTASTPRPCRRIAAARTLGLALALAGVSAFGWIYEGLDRSLGAWSAVSGCGRVLQPATTRTCATWVCAACAAALFEHMLAVGRAVSRAACARFPAPGLRTRVFALMYAAVWSSLLLVAGAAAAAAAAAWPEFDGGATNLSCFQHPRCTRGTFVMQCLYDGQHGMWPAQPGGDELVWWFMTRVVTGTRSAYV